MELLAYLLQCAEVVRAASLADCASYVVGNLVLWLRKKEEEGLQVSTSFYCMLGTIFQRTLTIVGE